MRKKILQSNHIKYFISSISVGFIQEPPSTTVWSSFLDLTSQVNYNRNRKSIFSDYIVVPKLFIHVQHRLRASAIRLNRIGFKVACLILI